MLVCVSLYVGVQNMVNVTKLHAKAAQAFEEVRSDVSTAQAALSESHIQIDQLKKEMYVLTELPEKARKDLASYRLAEQISRSDSEIDGIKALIEQTPEKALSLTLLRSDMKKNNAELEGRISSIDAQLQSARTYNIAFIAIIFTFVIYVIGFHWSQKRTD